MHTTDVGAVLPEVGSTSHTSAGPERRSLDVCGAAGTLLNTGRLSPGDFTSRPIGRNPDVASKAGRNSPCVSWSGDGRVGVSPLVPSPAADGASAPGRGDGDIAMSPSSTRSRARRRRRMRRRASAASSTPDEVSSVLSGEAPRDCGEQLYTLVNGVTGDVDGDIGLDPLPSLDALLELEEMSVADFGEALKAGDLAEVVMIRPEDELNSSSLLDEAVPEDTKQALNAR
ncbi:hypothetical protein PF004_g31861, partial [Phytophthora fragariae]